MGLLTGATVVVWCAMFGATAAPPGGDAYAAGWGAERSARYADAVTHYEKSAEADGPLTPFARMRAARCRGLGGQVDRATADLEALLATAGEGPWVRPALLELAWLYEKARRYTDAAACYERVWAEPLPPRWLERYRFTAAECLLKDDATRPRAYALLREVCASAVSNRVRMDAARHLAKSADPEDRFAAAYAMVRAAEFKEAEKLLPAAPEEPRLRYLQGRVMAGTGRAREAREVFQAVDAASPDTEWGRLSLGHLARSYAAGGLTAETDLVLQRLAGLAPGCEELADALSWLATARSTAPADAIRYHLQLARDCPRDARAPRGLLTAARLQHGAKRTGDAFETLDRLIESYPGNAALPEALFFRAGLRLERRESAEAVADLARAAEGGLGDYYAHRALERLHELDRARAVAAGPMLQVASDGALVRPLALTPVEEAVAPLDEPWHIRLHFFGSRGIEDGAWEAVELMRTASARPDPAAVYRAIGEAGLSAVALWMAPSCGVHVEGGTASLEWTRLRFPRAYWPLVQAKAAATGVDPYLLLSMALQESLFQADVTSSAGARGVMQVMPATATWLAQVEPAVTAEHARRLDDPASSLRMGAYYMMRMLDRADGNVAHALAAYNAGPGNLSKWRQRFPGMATDAFIEAIPFNETRHYVKRVLGNYAAYYSLYPDPAQERVAQADEGEEGGRGG